MDLAVDFDVVDYVLRKPFSDESFRRLLETVEADHLQVQYTAKRGFLSEGLKRVDVVLQSKLDAHRSLNDYLRAGLSCRSFMVVH